MTIENNYFSNFSLVEKFLCSAISFTPKEDAFELYEQMDDHIIFETAKKNLVDSIIGYRLIDIDIEPIFSQLPDRTGNKSAHSGCNG